MLLLEGRGFQVERKKRAYLVPLIQLLLGSIGHEVEENSGLEGHSRDDCIHRVRGEGL